jgi:hypothetical protein
LCYGFGNKKKGTGLENKEYLQEWRELMRRKPEEVYYTHTYLDREPDTVTVEDRRYSVAGIFAIEGWAVPPSMDEYIL